MMSLASSFSESKGSLPIAEAIGRPSRQPSLTCNIPLLALLNIISWDEPSETIPVLVCGVSFISICGIFHVSPIVLTGVSIVTALIYSFFCQTQEGVSDWMQQIEEQVAELAVGVLRFLFRTLAWDVPLYSTLFTVAVLFATCLFGVFEAHFVALVGWLALFAYVPITIATRGQRRRRDAHSLYNILAPMLRLVTLSEDGTISLSPISVPEEGKR